MGWVCEGVGHCVCLCRCIHFSLCMSRLSVCPDSISPTAVSFCTHSVALRHTHAHTHTPDYKTEELVTSARLALEEIEDADESGPVLQSYEVAALLNLAPNTVEKARVQVPSLNRVDDARLAAALRQIASFRASAQAGADDGGAGGEMAGL
jgi:hypothetical protein